MATAKQPKKNLAKGVGKTAAKAVAKKTAVKSATKTKKTGNMQSFFNVNDKLSQAQDAAMGAAYQMKVNKAKGKLDNLDYRASKTAEKRTKDLNRLNDTSKTLGRAKNIVSKQTQKAKKMKDIVSGKYKGPRG
jgi:DNA-binding transcriptional regulator GbsR (MarR family)